MSRPQITQIKDHRLHRLTQIILLYRKLNICIGKPMHSKRIAECTSLLVPMFLLLCSFVWAEEFIYDSHGKKDPFTPPVISAVEKAGTEVLAGVRLEGIIWDEKKPIAIINDKVVGVGDVVSGARIADIRQNEVIFAINGQTISVKLMVVEEAK